MFLKGFLKVCCMNYLQGVVSHERLRNTGLQPTFWIFGRSSHLPMQYTHFLWNIWINEHQQKKIGQQVALSRRSAAAF